MADEKILNEDDDLEIVEVDKLPTAEEIATREAATREAAAAETNEDDHEDDEDTRLAEREDDGVDEKSKEKRKKRRDAQKAARDRTLAQVDTLTRQNTELLQRMAAIEGHTVGITEREIGTKLTNAKARLADFDAILAKAVETGDGEGTVTAMRMRDEARDETRALEDTSARIKQAKDNPPAPKADPRVTQLADQWRTANPWYDTRGGDEDSAIVNAIDNRLTAEGFNPSSMDYWQELTKRVAKRIGTAETPAERNGAPAARKGPPVGGDRSAGTPGNRKEVYVTPERKQAMQDAGIWEDPVKRSKMLKSYHEYDAQQAAR